MRSVSKISNKCHNRAFALIVTLVSFFTLSAQINTDQVLKIGKNALYFEDYVLSIQYFNQVITAKPFLAEPYYYRAVAKISLDDYRGAEEDATLCIERNPFIVDAYQVRGVARQNQQKFNEAIDDYSQGLNLSPYDKPQLLNLAACLIQVKNFERADSTLQLLQRIDAKNDKVFIGLAHLNLEQGDTIAAIDAANSSINLNSNNFQAHILLAQVALKQDSLTAALHHLDEAIKLEPQQAGLFINRAYVKYKLDDYYGAMADFDYAIAIEPANATAVYNRSMLYAEVAENDKAIDGFSRVMQLEPDNFLALYNRAILLMKTGQFRKAIADIDQVLKRYPNFEAGYMMRADAKRRAGDNAGSERDMNYAINMMRKKGVHHSDYNPAKIENEKMAQKAAQQSDSIPEETEDDIMNRFNQLLTVDVDDSFQPEYSNRQRGRVQNARMEIEPEPFFMVSYYSPFDDDISIKQTHYVQEITAINEMRILPMTLVLSNRDVTLSGDEINRHFSSIEYFNGLITQNEPRAIDYIAIALEQLTVKNPEAAITAIEKAISRSPDQPVSFFIRACANYLYYKMSVKGGDDLLPDNEQDRQAARILREREAAKYLDDALKDLTTVIRLSPGNTYAHFNRGVIFMQQQNYTEAIAAFSSAIEQKPTLGEAYYNRGMIYLRLGNKAAGVADLSKAGELGVLPSYTVLKHFQ